MRGRGQVAGVLNEVPGGLQPNTGEAVNVVDCSFWLLDPDIVVPKRIGRLMTERLCSNHQVRALSGNDADAAAAQLGCALPGGTIAAIVGGMMGALSICENSKGVDIHFTAYP